MNTNKYLIVGAGISGATIARLLADDDNQVTVIEKEKFIGGNCYDFYDESNVLIHKFGPHIFHTSYDDVWKFVNRFSKFNGYINRVLVSVENELLQMPINFNSIKKLFSKEDYKNFVKECSNIKGESLSISELKELVKSESSLKIINFIYRNVYENYTSKMWGIPINKIDKDIIKRVKINLNKIWNYFPNDKYQGLPIDGYTKMISNMLNHENIKIENNIDFLENIKFKNNKIIYNNEEYITIYTGELDRLFNYKYGELEYRSLNIEFTTHNLNYYQKVGVINYPADKKITRITEYKHLTKQKIKGATTISSEEPGKYNKNSKKFNKPLYPISDKKNNELANKYKKESKKITNLYLLGRLSDYKYYDMDDAIKGAFALYKKIMQN